MTRYRLYSGLFLGLPFERLQQSARLLPVFTEHCRRGLTRGAAPVDIVDRFFAETPLLSGVDRHDVLFLFAQFVERQIVLFDALEDESFRQTHEFDATGSVTELIESTLREGQQARLGRLLERTATRIVLTAHPTQFYPRTVQGIITDLRRALVRRDAAGVERLLLQLGKTRFTNRTRPTPVEEATRLIDVVAEVFYDVMPTIAGRTLTAAHGRDALASHLPTQPNLQLGFWPGGDRDGNPFVTAAVTEHVARLMRCRVVDCHLGTATALARRLTFEGAHEAIQQIVARLNATRLASETHSSPLALEGSPAPYSDADELLGDVLVLRKLVVDHHDGLFVEEIDDLLIKVHLFGFYLGSIDLRQSSDVLLATLREVAEQSALAGDVGSVPRSDVFGGPTLADLERWMTSDVTVTEENLVRLSALSRDTLATLRLVPVIQRRNGVRGIHRMIVSHTHAATDVLIVLVLARLAGLDLESMSLDVVPLFESIEDLERSETTLAELFACQPYRDHLERHGNRQVVMMGFSDGTKDGGYVTANLAIRRAKRRLSRLGRQYGIELAFFDGRGGPPARGGGNTHRFYRSRDLGIEQWHQQLTIQGQTIGSNFGSTDLARYHVEQLFTANLENHLWPAPGEDPPPAYHAILDDLSQGAESAYRSLRNDPLLRDFLAEHSPLPLFGDLTVGSRPVARGRAGALDLSQLRAIPFVAAWSVLKMQVPGFYGLGAALEPLLIGPRESELRDLYRDSRFFRTLLDNAAMSLLKSRLDLHAHLEQGTKFAPLLIRVREETERSQRAILQLSRQPHLLANDPVTRRSIEVREQIVLPLLVIVQYAYLRYLEHFRTGGSNSREANLLHKLSLKGIGSIVNATRNAA